MAVIKPLEEMTMGELKEEISALGQAGIATTLNTRSQALAVLAGLKANPGNPENVTLPKVEELTPPLNTISDREVNKAAISKTKRMEEKLNSQPKVQVFLALEGKERMGEVKETIVNGQRKIVTEGTVETVQLNGFTTYIPKGKPVLVPQQVAQELGQAQVETANAGKAFEIDRPDTEHAETPFQTVGEALDK